MYFFQHKIYSILINIIGSRIGIKYITVVFANNIIKP